MSVLEPSPVSEIAGFHLASFLLSDVVVPETVVIVVVIDRDDVLIRDVSGTLDIVKLCIRLLWEVGKTLLDLWVELILGNVALFVVDLATISLPIELLHLHHGSLG